MRILIVGNGGREHALLWKLKRQVRRVRNRSIQLWEFRHECLADTVLSQQHDRRINSLTNPCSFTLQQLTPASAQIAPGTTQVEPEELPLVAVR